MLNGEWKVIISELSSDRSLDTTMMSIVRAFNAVNRFTQPIRFDVSDVAFNMTFTKLHLIYSNEEKIVDKKDVNRVVKKVLKRLRKAYPFYMIESVSIDNHFKNALEQSFEKEFKKLLHDDFKGKNGIAFINIPKDALNDFQCKTLSNAENTVISRISVEVFDDHYEKYLFMKDESTIIARMYIDGINILNLFVCDDTDTKNGKMIQVPLSSIRMKGDFKFANSVERCDALLFAIAEINHYFKERENKEVVDDEPEVEDKLSYQDMILKVCWNISLYDSTVADMFEKGIVPSDEFINGKYQVFLGNKYGRDVDAINRVFCKQESDSREIFEKYLKGELKVV